MIQKKLLDPRKITLFGYDWVNVKQIHPVFKKLKK
jgi:hypothetical protein